MLLKLLTLIALSLLCLPSQAESLERWVVVDGMQRSYIAYLPEGVRHRANVSVVFAFHPFLGSGKGFAKQTGLEKLPETDRFIFVFPNGYRRSWNAGDGCGAANKKDIDDIAFVKAIFKDLRTIARVSRDHNFAIGFSNGAMFSQKLICHMPARFAGFAVSGGLYDLKDGCHLDRAVSAVFMSGSEDPYSPFYGGKSEAGGGHRPGVPTVSKAWANKESCQSQEPSVLTKGVPCIGYIQCLEGARVLSCPIPKMGHWWPGQKGKHFAQKKLGPDRPDLQVSEAILRFFLSI